MSVTAHGEPIDKHIFHCNVCKSVTGQQTTRVACYTHGNLTASNEGGMTRQPFNADNPEGPLELCTCAECGAPLMLDDKMNRIRVAVRNIMGYDDATFPDATYHAFYDDTKRYPKPDDGRPVYDGLRPDFTWPRPWT